MSDRTEIHLRLPYDWSCFLPIGCLVNATCISHVLLATAEVCNCTVVSKMGRHVHVCLDINVNDKQPAMFNTRALHQPQMSSMCKNLVDPIFHPLSFSTPSSNIVYKLYSNTYGRQHLYGRHHSSNQPFLHTPPIHPKGRKSFSPTMRAVWRPCTSKPVYPIWRKSWLYMLYFQTNRNIALLKIHLAKTLQSRGWREMTGRIVLCRYCSVFPFRKWFPLTPSGPAALIKVIWDSFFFLKTGRSVSVNNKQAI